MTKEEEKKPSSINVSVSLTILGILDLPHKHRLALCERFVMSPRGPSLVIELHAL